MWETIVALSISVPVITLLLLRWFLRKEIPIILQEVGEGFGEQLKKTFATPNIKRAFSILGQQSGDTRRESGAERVIAEGILSNVTPEIKIILDQIAPNIIEDYGAETVLRLVAKYGPMLSKFLPKSLNTPKEDSKSESWKSP